MSELYPEAIYGTRNGGTMTPKQRDGFGGMARRYAYNLGYADGWVDRGKSVMPVPAGWSNLTEAIQAGERIDWDALDGLEAKCVHTGLGTLTYKLERDICYSETSFNGWYLEPVNLAWENAILDAWQGTCGWSLWVKGDLPLRKRTADELEPGTCFSARHNKGEYTQSYSYAQVVRADGQRPMVVCYSRYLTDIFATIPPEEAEVLEVYGVGTFDTPEGDA